MSAYKYVEEFVDAINVSHIFNPHSVCDYVRFNFDLSELCEKSIEELRLIVFKCYVYACGYQDDGRLEKLYKITIDILDKFEEQS